MTPPLPFPLYVYIYIYIGVPFMTGATKLDFRNLISMDAASVVVIGRRRFLVQN